MSWRAKNFNADLTDGRHASDGSLGSFLAATDKVNDYAANIQKMDKIDESTVAAGVTIEGLLLKDKLIETGTAAVAGKVTFHAGDGKNVTMKSVAGMGASWDMTLPPNDGNANDVLISNGSGVATWVDVDTIVSSGTKYVGFYPTFPHEVIINDGSNNTIDIEKKNTGTDDWENYYNVESAEATLQDLDIYFMWKIPSDLTTWDTDHAIDIVIMTETIDILDQKVDINFYEVGTAAAHKSLADQKSAVAATKVTLSITAADLSSFVANDVMVINIKAYSKSSNYVNIYSVVAKYTT